MAQGDAGLTVRTESFARSKTRSAHTAGALGAAPKALLHDHLDGGLRPATVIELADEIGWGLPSTDVAELQAWFTAGAESGDLLQYLATFEHTLAVMQTPEHIERVAFEAVIDLAADGVVYHEVRFAPELHTAMAPQEAVEAVTAGLRRGEAEAAATGRPSPPTSSAAPCARPTGRWRSPGWWTRCGRGTRRSSPSTSPAPRPASRRRATPRRWRSPATVT